MFKYGISCSLERQPLRQPTILRGDIRCIASRAARIGYDGIELFMRDPKRYDASDLKATAKAHGLEYCGIATGMEQTKNGLCLISDDPAVRRAAIERLKEHLDLGAELECPVIVGIMRGNIPDFSKYRMYEDYLSAALVELDEYAERCGSEMVMESIVRYISNYMNSAPETAVYLRRLNLKHMKLHIDTHSMIVEDRDLAKSVHETADILGYVHFSDSNRAYPGAGAVDFKAVVRALSDVGYDGYITSEYQPYPNEEESASRGLQYMQALETIVQIEKKDLMTGVDMYGE